MPSLLHVEKKLLERVADLNNANRAKGSKSPTALSRRKIVLEANVQNAHIKLDGCNVRLAEMKAQVNWLEKCLE